MGRIMNSLLHPADVDVEAMTQKRMDDDVFEEPEQSVTALLQPANVDVEARKRERAEAAKKKFRIGVHALVACIRFSRRIALHDLEVDEDFSDESWQELLGF